MMMTKNYRRRGTISEGIGLLVIVVVAVLLLQYFKPEWIRGGDQPPIAATVRSSLVGLGRVLRLTNQGDRAITHVSVRAENAAHNSHIGYVITRIEPGDTAELGWQQWNWNIDPGETYTITADGYSDPIVFSSSQLGVN